MTVEVCDPIHLDGGFAGTLCPGRVEGYRSRVGSVDGSERDARGSTRDRAAERRDARDRTRDVAAAARDVAADARDHSARLREQLMRDGLWAEEIHDEVQAYWHEASDPEAGPEPRLEQALIDSEEAISRAAMLRAEVRAFLDETRQQRIDAEADRQASRQDRMDSDCSRDQAAQDRQAAEQDREAAASERDRDELARNSAMPDVDPADQG